ncbi:MAG: hypothetical protein M1826_000021 [Phylliscum demangeonii]|nr:MAG: hypothetical protein M1826_000021 [Phylliscum demangeonii]
MSLVNLSHVCSHLQNASKARLGLTSVRSTNLHLRLLLGLRASGFLSTVIRGGPDPPRLLSPTSLMPEPDDAEAEADAAVTQANVASRRLWLGLKYWNSEPVLRQMSMVSKPTKRIHMDCRGLGLLVRGKESGYVKGLTNPGECLFVSTDRGVMEARECVERQIGGLLLCRVL